MKEISNTKHENLGKTVPDGGDSPYQCFVSVRLCLALGNMSFFPETVRAETPADINQPHIHRIFFDILEVFSPIGHFVPMIPTHGMERRLKFALGANICCECHFRL